AHDEVEPLVQQQTRDAEDDPERDEDEGEAEDEEGHPKQQSASGAARVGILLGVAGEAADVPEVAGDEREDARGRERDEAREQRDRQRNEEVAAEDEFTDRVTHPVLPVLGVSFATRLMMASRIDFA